MKKQTRVIFTSALILALFALSGCQTFKGMGKDIESLGESMQSSAE